MVAVKVANPVSMLVPANETCDVSAVSNASYWQVLTVVDGSNTYKLVGSGENAPMQTTSGQPAINMLSQQYDRNVMFNFGYSAYRNGPLQSASVNAPTTTTYNDGNLTYTKTTIQSEDGVDNDDNDTYATITCIKNNR